MAKAITDLTTVSATASGDILPIVDVSASPDETKQITVSDLFDNVPVNVGIGASPNNPLTVSGSQDISDSLLVGSTGTPASPEDVLVRSTKFAYQILEGDTDGDAGTGNAISTLDFRWNGTDIVRLQARAGDDTTNMDEADLVAYTATAGTLREVARFHQEGDVELGQAGRVGVGTNTHPSTEPAGSGSNLTVQGGTDSSDIVVNAQSNSPAAYNWMVSGNPKWRMDYDPGNVNLRIRDDSNNQTHVIFNDNGTTELLKTMTLGMAGSQNYQLQGSGKFLNLVGQSAGNTAALGLASAEQDGTEFVGLSVFGVGKFGESDNERLRIRYNPTNSQLEVKSTASGSGSLRPLHMFTEGNADQLVARTDGNVSMANSLLVGGTGSPKGEFEVLASTSINLGDGSSVWNLNLEGDVGTTDTPTTRFRFKWAGTAIAGISAVSGDDTTNKDEGDLRFRTASAGNLSEVARFHQEGDVELGQNGNVGIGGAAGPANINTRLHVRESDNGSVAAKVQNVDDVNGGNARFAIDCGTGGKAELDFLESGTTTWRIDYLSDASEWRLKRFIGSNITILSVQDSESSPRLPNVPSATQSSDLVLDSTNQMVTPSSSQRYKTNIQTWNTTDILQADARTFQHHGRPDRGFIAEELAEHSPHLVRWEHPHDVDDPVTDEYLQDHARDDGKVPDGVHYKRVTAAHHIILGDHDSRIEMLEQENQRLRERVNQLDPHA
jgi:hypothetical protein